MSSDIVPVYEGYYLHTLIGNTIITMVVYEHIITFSSEVDLYWRRKGGLAHALFFANRYINLIDNGPLWRWLQSSTPFVNCIVSYYLSTVIIVARWFVLGAISGLRAFAVNGGRYPIPILVSLLYCVPLAQTIIITSSTTVGSRVALILADGIVAALTWWTTRSAARLHRKTLGGNASFARLLLRDGTIYFVVFTILNVLHLIVVPDHKGVVVSAVGSYTTPITSILISRFLLHLRRLNKRITEPTLPSQADDLHGLSTIDFEMKYPSSEARSDDNPEQTSAIGVSRLLHGLTLCSSSPPLQALSASPPFLPANLCPTLAPLTGACPPAVTNPDARLFKSAYEGEVKWFGTPGGRLALLHVDDLTELYVLTAEKAPIVRGQLIDASNAINESVDAVLQRLVEISDAKGYSSIEPTNVFETSLITTGICGLT
ncbi:hypothetical protein C8Q76DRAFT_803577 [Earliella scabrosa]|nr:hypothetical protein C8Q76DRAFT_803577 [Earliella scabrosa]